MKFNLKGARLHPLHGLEVIDEYGNAYLCGEKITMAEEEGGTLTSSTAPGLTVLGDRQLLAQALTNLLDNALDFTPPGGTIRIAAERQGEPADPDHPARAEPFFEAGADNRLLVRRLRLRLRLRWRRGAR